MLALIPPCPQKRRLALDSELHFYGQSVGGNSRHGGLVYHAVAYSPFEAMDIRLKGPGLAASFGCPWLCLAGGSAGRQRLAASHKKCSYTSHCRLAFNEFALTRDRDPVCRGARHPAFTRLCVSATSPAAMSSLPGTQISVPRSLRTLCSWVALLMTGVKSGREPPALEVASRAHEPRN